MDQITPDDLGKRTRQIVEYYFSNPSKTRKQIAADLKIHESRISQVLNHPKVLACYRVLARNHVAGMVPRSLVALTSCIDQNDNLQVKLNAAKSVLSNEKVFDFQPSIQINNQITFKSVAELQDIVNDVKHIQSGDVVDAEITDEKPTL